MLLCSSVHLFIVFTSQVSSIPEEDQRPSQLNRSQYPDAYSSLSTGDYKVLQCQEGDTPAQGGYVCNGPGASYQALLFARAQPQWIMTTTLNR
jgi:hypothetical protein